MRQTINCMRLTKFSILGLLLSASVGFSQQVGVVDLTAPEVAETQTKGDQLAPGCTQETVGVMANGAVVSNGGPPPRISLEIVKLSSDILEVGGEGRAEVRLRNVGETPIQIPWSRDSSVFRKAPNPDHLEWEQGSLGVVMVDTQNHRIALKSAVPWLFGSQFATGSPITIKPGEWITALLSFKLEDMYHTNSSKEFPIGDAKLLVESSRTCVD
jgi:hypothetical protein